VSIVDSFDHLFYNDGQTGNEVLLLHVLRRQAVLSVLILDIVKRICMLLTVLACYKTKSQVSKVCGCRIPISQSFPATFSLPVYIQPGDLNEVLAPLVCEAIAWPRSEIWVHLR